MINILPGRYAILLATGSTVVVEGTQAQLDQLYLRISSPHIAVLGFVGYGWIAPEDYDANPVTGVITTFLGVVTPPALG